jgi:IS605 OrfB family transposase
VVKSKNRKMNRNLMDLQHYMFKMKLESKSRVRGSKKIEITEEYTSKT